MSELEKIKKELEELNNKVKELEKEKNKKWKLKKGDEYYCFDFREEGIKAYFYRDDYVDKINFILGNYFTKNDDMKECKNKVIKTIEKLELLTELQNYAEEINEGWKPDWDNEDEYKYHIYFNFDAKVFENDYCWKRKGLNETVFKSKELAEQAIEHFGERLNLLIEG